jgi:gliding motility-associatede transport system auxiliary component
MNDDTPPKPSFTPGRKWTVGFDVVVRTLAVLAVLVMANYLAGRYFGRHYLSSQTRVELAPRTVSILEALTNDVKVTLYYDRDDPLFSSISELLHEYEAINPHLSVQIVDYTRDAVEAQHVKEAYKLGTPAKEDEKNLVIFDCEGRVKIVPGKALAEYTLEQIPDETDRKFRRKLVSFNGEMMFTSLLLAVINPKPLTAYFLQNHGEHSIDSADKVTGYMEFANVLKQNYIKPEQISLLGTNEIPSDCNLLVIAGPTEAISETELKKIEQYLEEGGRMLALFNPTERDHQSGLEEIVKRWGVIVSDATVRDPAQSEGGSDVIISAYSRHPVVNPLLGSGLQLILPRPLQAVQAEGREADAPKVEAVAFTGEQAYLTGSPQKRGRYAVIATVEKGAVRGVITERGTTRILVVGDSLLFGNGLIGKWENRDFAGLAVNWLLDRTELLKGLGPKPVAELHINMTHSQLQSVEWILLAALPGVVLLMGVVVWLGRRN